MAGAPPATQKESEHENESPRTRRSRRSLRGPDRACASALVRLSMCFRARVRDGHLECVGPVRGSLVQHRAASDPGHSTRVPTGVCTGAIGAAGCHRGVSRTPGDREGVEIMGTTDLRRPPLAGLYAVLHARARGGRCRDSRHWSRRRNFAFDCRRSCRSRAVSFAARAFPTGMSSSGCRTLPPDRQPALAPPHGLQPSGTASVTPRSSGRAARTSPTRGNPFLPAGALSEDCLYLNVYTPSVRHQGRIGR